VHGILSVRTTHCDPSDAVIILLWIGYDDYEDDDFT